MKLDTSRIKDCYHCANCQYIGEGDSLCDMHQAIVLSDFTPTDEYMTCGGEDFEAE